jgi:YHS domain-containing protein
MSLFGRLFESLFSGQPAKEIEQSGRPEEELDQALKEIRSRVNTAENDAPELSRIEESKQQKEQLHERLRSDLFADILELHQQLGTGLDQFTLTRLRDITLGHEAIEEPPEDLEVSRRIDNAVLLYLFRQCANRAWSELEKKLADENLSWPVPDGIKLHRSPDEIAKHSQKHTTSLYQEFPLAPMKAQANLTVGEIEVWGAAYPEPGGWLWLQTKFRAVGAGLQLKLFVGALESWLWRDKEVDQELQNEVEKALAQARSLLNRGSLSLADADDLASQVRQVCSATIPQLVWERLGPNLENDTFSSTLLAEEKAKIVDPVCRMALSGDRILIRHQLENKTYYFCSDQCFQKFRSTPRQYVVAEE